MLNELQLFNARLRVRTQNVGISDPLDPTMRPRTITGSESENCFLLMQSGQLITLGDNPPQKGIVTIIKCDVPSATVVSSQSGELASLSLKAGDCLTVFVVEGQWDVVKKRYINLWKIWTLYRANPIVVPPKNQDLGRVSSGTPNVIFDCEGALEKTFTFQLGFGTMDSTGIIPINFADGGKYAIIHSVKGDGQDVILPLVFSYANCKYGDGSSIGGYDLSASAKYTVFRFRGIGGVLVLEDVFTH